jgi:hypothetical protein
MLQFWPIPVMAGFAALCFYLAWRWRAEAQGMEIVEDDEA